MIYANIVVCLDLRYHEAALLLRRGGDLLAPGGRLTALTVVELGTFDDAREAVASLVEEEYNIRSAHLARLCAEAGLADAERRVQVGKAAEEIAGFARNNGCDLVVMGEHGQRSWRPRLGSTVDAALRSLDCDALVIKATPAEGG